MDDRHYMWVSQCPLGSTSTHSLDDISRPKNFNVSMDQIKLRWYVPQKNAKIASIGQKNFPSHFKSSMPCFHFERCFCANI